MGLSIIVDWYRARDLRRVAAESHSQALEADALHFSTDIVSSTVVVLGLVGVMAARHFGKEWLALADPVAACIVAIIVLFLSWKLGQRAVDVLMDRAPAGLSTRIRSSLAGIQGVQGAPLIRVRQAGDRVFADIAIVLSPGLPVAEGDRIAARARAAVKEIAGDEASVFVQLQADRAETASLRERVSTAVAMAGEIAHNVTLRRSAAGVQADLHLELPGKLTLAEAHDVADRVEARILGQVPELGRVDIHLELRAEEPDRANPIDPEVHAAIESRVRQAAAEVVSEGAVHDLMIAQTRGGIYLSCHCFLPPDTPLEEAHTRTDRLEARLRRAVPELIRVSVHAEPESHDP